MILKYRKIIALGLSILLLLPQPATARWVTWTKNVISYLVWGRNTVTAQQAANSLTRAFQARPPKIQHKIIKILNEKVDAIEELASRRERSAWSHLITSTTPVVVIDSALVGLSVLPFNLIEYAIQNPTFGATQALAIGSTAGIRHVKNWMKKAQLEDEMALATNTLKRLHIPDGTEYPLTNQTNRFITSLLHPLDDRIIGPDPRQGMFEDPEFYKILKEVGDTLNKQTEKIKALRTFQHLSQNRI